MASQLRQAKPPKRNQAVTNNMQLVANALKAKGPMTLDALCTAVPGMDVLELADALEALMAVPNGPGLPKVHTKAKKIGDGMWDTLYIHSGTPTK
jgi:hypothetical protein